MNQLAKVIATMIVWTAAAGMVISSNSPLQKDWVMPIIALMALIAATSSMRYIWRETDSSVIDRIAAARSAEKTKRATRVEHLLNNLDDSDLDELRARLTGDDGEQIPLEELMNRQSGRRSG